MDDKIIFINRPGSGDHDHGPGLGGGGSGGGECTRADQKLILGSKVW